MVRTTAHLAWSAPERRESAAPRWSAVARVVGEAVVARAEARAAVAMPAATVVTVLTVVAMVAAAAGGNGRA